MSTRTGATATALIVVDVQRAVMNESFDSPAVIGRIASVLECARTAGAPVVWVQHGADDLVPGSDGWQIVPELVPAEGEARVFKRYGDAFEGTDLEPLLDGFGAGALVVVGAETDACIRSTIHGAFTRGYDVTLVTDAHTASDKSAWGAPPVEAVIAHTNLYWSFQSAPGRTAATVASADVAF